MFPLASSAAKRIFFFPSLFPLPIFGFKSCFPRESGIKWEKYSPDVHMFLNLFAPGTAFHFGKSDYVVIYQCVR